jgi:hypothetical protein
VLREQEKTSKKAMHAQQLTPLSHGGGSQRSDFRRT